MQDIYIYIYIYIYISNPYLKTTNWNPGKYLRKKWLSVKHNKTFFYAISYLIYTCIYVCFDLCFFRFEDEKDWKLLPAFIILSLLGAYLEEKKGTQKIHHIRVYLTKEKYIAELPGLDSFITT